jgi:hypothetical protein
MKTYVASGKDILSAEDMKAGIDHGKGTFLKIVYIPIFSSPVVRRKSVRLCPSACL